MDDGYLAEIKMFAGNFPPRGWAFCAGQLLPISQNSALFSLIGTIYGGDGRTTFALPDMRSRVAVQQGTGHGLRTWDLGQMAGTETNTLNNTQLPYHTHTATATVQVNSEVGVFNGDPNKGKPGGNQLSKATSGQIYSDASPDATLGGVSATGTADVVVHPAGGSVPVNNIQPIIGMNFIICLQGLYPSRS